jgi:hypothetical protein
MSYGDVVSKSILPYTAIAGVTRTPHQVGVPYKIITANLPFNFPHPQVGISFSKPKESVIEDLKKIGFIEDTHGRFRYYRGTPDPKYIRTILELGPSASAFVPAGVCDLTGFEAYIITSKVITAILQSIARPGKGGVVVDSTPKAVTEIRHGTKLLESVRMPALVDSLVIQEGMAYDLGDSDSTYIIDKATDVEKTHGHFAPYFKGLVLPDKMMVPQFLTEHFSALLGTTPQEQNQAAQTLRSGWSTFASTETGLQLQHVVFFIRLSISTGMKPYLFMQNNMYQGMILRTRHVSIFCKGIENKPLSKKEFVKEVSKYNSHDVALAEVCRIIGEIPSLEEEVFIRPSTNTLTSARSIHNILRLLKVSPAEHSDLKDQFKLLSFGEKPLDPRNPVDLMKVFKAASQGDFLSKDVYISIQDEAMFTKDVIVSSFGAFGASAPSFFDPLGTPLPIVQNNSENRKRYGAEQIFIHNRKAKGDLVLPNGKIPVFIKPVLPAVQDFRHMIGGHAVAYRYTPRGGVAGAAYVVEKASTDSIARMLISCFAPKKTTKDNRGTKRDRDEAGISEINKEIDRPSKKPKETGGMWDFIALAQQLPAGQEGTVWNAEESADDEEMS